MEKKIIFFRINSILNYVVAVTWMLLMTRSESYFIPFFVVGVGCIYSISKRESIQKPTAYEKIWINLGALLFTSAVTMANNEVSDGGIGLLLCFGMGFFVARPVFSYLICVPRDKITIQENSCPCGMRWYLISFILIAAVNLGALFSAFYPGVVTNDSTTQLFEIASGNYHNHHPFYHTQIVRFFYNFGISLFGSPNAGVACYNVFQILVMAGIFSYVIMTSFQACGSRKWTYLCLAWFALMPFHIAYSFNMWKDTLWSGMMVLFLTSMYRVLYKIGKHRYWNGGILFVSSIGVCLLRSNGLIAFALTVVVFAAFFAKKYPKIMAILVFAAVISWIMKNPVLKAWNVTQPDILESLSIPIQQIARVVHNGLNLSDTEYTLLEQIVDVDQMGTRYLTYISDPIKDLIREGNNVERITENKWEYFKLWIDIGLKYPDEYLKAWIDQTKGYWNGGYNYYIYAEDMSKHAQELNIYQVYSEAIRASWRQHLEFTIHPVFCIFVSIGFHVWIVAAATITFIAKRQWTGVLITVPLLAVVATLMIATPVFSEFRYAYGIISCVPIVLIAFFKDMRQSPE